MNIYCRKLYGEITANQIASIGILNFMPLISPSQFSTSMN